MHKDDELEFVRRACRTTGGTRAVEDDVYWAGRVVGNRHELYAPGEEQPVVVVLDVPQLDYHGEFSRLILGRTMALEVAQAVRGLVSRLTGAVAPSGRTA